MLRSWRLCVLRLMVSSGGPIRSLDVLHLRMWIAEAQPATTGGLSTKCFGLLA
jgi:hypothetical protein